MRPTWGGVVDWGGEAHSPTQRLSASWQPACISMTMVQWISNEFLDNREPLHCRRHAVSRLSRSPLREGQHPVAAAALLDRAISCRSSPSRHHINTRN